mmetsp:Transcript_94246/g.163628  ORF Transcript_94246/g.163628 Transcript_94246/m.163628 type:complete len:216 (-) Transcript_94246:1466-2113(-)
MSPHLVLASQPYPDPPTLLRLSPPPCKQLTTVVSELPAPSPEGPPKGPAHLTPCEPQPLPLMQPLWPSTATCQRCHMPCLMLPPIQPLRLRSHCLFGEHASQQTLLWPRLMHSVQPPRPCACEQQLRYLPAVCQAPAAHLEARPPFQPSLFAKNPRESATGSSRRLTRQHETPQLPSRGQLMKPAPPQHLPAIPHADAQVVTLFALLPAFVAAMQ